LKEMKRKNRMLPLALGFVIVLAVLVLGGGMVLAEEGDFEGGKGTFGDPYRIANAGQLDNVRNYLGDSYSNKFFKLTADIELGDYANDYDDGKGWVPIGSGVGENFFTGFFDGGGYTISGLFINRPSYVGLFGEIRGAGIKNVRLEGVDVTGSQWVGSLVGMNKSGTIENSYATGDVSGNSLVGGLVGNNNGAVYRSHAAVNVTGIGSVADIEKIGGLAGFNFGDIKDSYATGAVSGNSLVGGLVGDNNGGTIENSYATGAVSGNSIVGGLVGQAGTVTDSFWDTQASGQSDSAGGTGKTTAQMKQQDTFDDWDFADAWEIDTGTYPYLKWQQDYKDFAPPVFAERYPEAVNIINNALDLQIKTDEDATAYYVVLGDGEDEPSAAQVKAGTDADDENLAANLKGSIELLAGTVGTVSITGLFQEAAYDIYVTAEDSALNLQPDVSVEMVEVTTTLVPTEIVTFGLTAPSTAIAGNSIAVNQSYPKGVEVNTVNGTPEVVITSAITEYQSVAVAGTDAGKVTEAGGEANPTFTVNTSEIASAGGTYEFTLTVSEGGKADIVYEVTVTVAPADITPPVAGDGGDISISNVTHNSMVLTWAAAADDETLEQYLQYMVVYSENEDIETVAGAETNGTTVKDWTANLTGTQVSSLSADTAYYFNIIVKDQAGNKAEYNMTSQATESEPSGGGSGGGGRRRAPDYNAKVTDGGAPRTGISIDVNTRSGSAVVSLGKLAEDVLGGEEIPVITVPPIQGVDTYALELPGTCLCSSSAGDILTFSTDAGSITIPGNMLTGTESESPGDIGITIGEGDKSGLPGHVREAIGDRPIVQLTLTVEGEKESWSNPNAPVTVSIPYTPTQEELSDPEHIVVWYIDGEGNAVEVPNGRYDPVTGTVTFATTHFSRYAVVYVQKTFDDIGSVEWARQQIEVLASKGIVRGMTDSGYFPAVNITRADFLYSLVRTLGVDAAVEGNFDDIKGSAYYCKEIGIAKELGITSGTGDNKFCPDESITRQDMVTLTVRALDMLGMVKEQGPISGLDKFTDKSLIAGYALESIATAVKEGLIIGSGDNINPLGNTTRAEAAVFLYRIYNK
jgi:hypothetical protein